jgi:hypothetical protein
MDRIDGRAGIIVEEGDELGGIDGFADGGRAAQVGEPQHGIDAVGDAARDAPAQNALCRIAPEIDMTEGAGDAGIG